MKVNVLPRAAENWLYAWISAARFVASRNWPPVAEARPRSALTPLADPATLTA